MDIDFTALSGPFKTSIIRVNGKSVGWIRNKKPHGYMLKINGAQWDGEFNGEKISTDLKMFKTIKEARDFAKQYLTNTPK